MKGLKAIDFFCGGGGMTCGLRQAGISVIAGIDIDAEAKSTYEFNNEGSKFVNEDIKRLPIDFFSKEFDIKKEDDTLVMVGCSPCQFYSIINTDKAKSLKSKDLLKYFAKFIGHYLPGFVIVENVPGIITNKESVFPFFLDEMERYGYHNMEYGVVNMSKFGVPQSRKRFSLIATRIKGCKVSLPREDSETSLLKDFLGVNNGFYTIPAGHKDMSDFNHTTAGLSKINLDRIRATSHNGGNRLEWANDKRLQLSCFEGKDDSFRDSFGRMWWNKPSPTITTKFYSLSNGRFGHPDEDRALSLREGATLQTFPQNYVFKTNSIASTARLIGNAVPCEYARRLGKTMIEI